MIRSFLFALALMPATIRAQSAPQSSLPRDAIRTEVRAVNDSMEAAFNRGDLKGVAHFYADHARMRGPQGIGTSGRSAIDAYWSSIRNPVRWKLDVIEVGGNPNLAYQIGKSHLTSRRGAEERTYTTDFVVIWERQPDGALRILLDLWN